jgi:hypothetical protein
MGCAAAPATSGESSSQGSAESSADASAEGSSSESGGTDSATTAISTNGICDGSTGEFELSEGESSGGSAEDTNGGMGGDIPIGVTVFAVRQEEVDSGTLVEIADLVVIAPIVTTPTGKLVFLQATEGGEYSAITAAAAGSDAAFPIGTRVRVVGRVARRGSFSRIIVDGDVEEIVDEGTAALPDPFVVQLADLADPAAALDPYDSALVRVETPKVLDEDLCPGEFSIAAALRVDDLFLGDLAPSPAMGSQYSAILGALRATGDGFEVAPRSLDDLQP